MSKVKDAEGPGTEYVMTFTSCQQTKWPFCFGVGTMTWNKVVLSFSLSLFLFNALHNNLRYILSNIRLVASLEARLTRGRFVLAQRHPARSLMRVELEELRQPR